MGLASVCALCLFGSMWVINWNQFLKKHTKYSHKHPLKPSTHPWSGQTDGTHSKLPIWNEGTCVTNILCEVIVQAYTTHKRIYEDSFRDPLMHYITVLKVNPALLFLKGEVSCIQSLISRPSHSSRTTEIPSSYRWAESPICIRWGGAMYNISRSFQAWFSFNSCTAWASQSQVKRVKILLSY